MATDNNDDDDVSVPEAARFFGVHQRTIHKWAERISGFGWRPHPTARLRIISWLEHERGSRSI